MKKETYKIIQKKGKLQGPSVTVMCGVHGNEKAGIMVVDYLKENLEVRRGVVNLVYANIPAIEKNVRLVNKNLNRNFIRKNDLKVYEDTTAEVLMDLLDTSDALLDLHAYNDSENKGICFGICEKDCFDVMSLLDVNIVISGLSKLQKGSSDGYMNEQSKPGVCIELGSVNNPEDFFEKGVVTTLSFLSFFNCIDLQPKKEFEQNHFYAYYMHKRESNQFSFMKKYKTFDPVKKGELVAQDGEKKIYAKEEGLILFPRENNPIGVEAFVLTKRYE